MDKRVPDGMKEVVERLKDLLFGPRTWAVVNDCDPGWEEIYACPESRICETDRVLASGLRRGEAQRRARQEVAALTGSDQ